MNTIHYKNGNVSVSIAGDGTKIREWEGESKLIYPESIDCKITNYCDLNCPWCHEKSNTSGKHADINVLLETIKSLPAGTELSVGGGNALSHPHLIQLLNELSDRGLIANITVNQKHILTYFETIRYLLNKELIHGLGISITDVEHLSDIEPILRLTDNAVFHVIMGINPVDVVDKLEDFCWHQGKGCKVLVLGYKDFGRGSSFLQKHSSIEDNKYQWYIGIAKHFKRQGLVLSFDNLALEQLNLSRFFTRDAWDKFYMGDDGFATCYIDAVNQQYAISSADSNRTSFQDISLLDFFGKIPR